MRYVMTSPESVRSLKESDRRRWPRYRLGEHAAFVLIADGQSRGCRIEDISLGGAKLRLEGETPRNLEVRIEHPAAGYVYANRCWSEPGILGIEFDLSAQALDVIAYCLELLDDSGGDVSSKVAP